jgi:hypothetical protein
MARKGTGTGQGGKSFQDRALAASVRTKALQDIKLVLSDSKKVQAWTEYKRQMLLKLSTTLLPRLNEHTGEDGGALIISFDKTFSGAA